mmetsp:Transcript_15262/g.22928  ORF Transcript_15262/g.22928 Transcript_15262/m.22928 type:complete len:378 (-) Transcript_15262:19-1152(-)
MMLFRRRFLRETCRIQEKLLCRIRNAREFWWWRNSEKEKENEYNKLIKALVAGQERVLETLVENGRAKTEQQERKNKINTRVCLLIDAENCSYQTIPNIMRFVNRFGTISAARIYGDWASTLLNGWRNRLFDYAIVPVQNFSYISGKSSSDASLIIDAMDLLHSGRYSVFVLVSSDSDFTRLATRIREDGNIVIGIGRRQTSLAFVQACHTFQYVETLETSKESDDIVMVDDGQSSKQRIFRKRMNSKINQIVDEFADDDGWAMLSIIGTEVRKDPEFDLKILVHDKNTPANLSTYLRQLGYKIQPRGPKNELHVRSRRRNHHSNGNNKKNDNTSNNMNNGEEQNDDDDDYCSNNDNDDGQPSSPQQQRKLKANITI